MRNANMKCRSLAKRIIITKKDGGHMHFTHDTQTKIIILTIKTKMKNTKN